MFGFEHYLNQSVASLLNRILLNARFTIRVPTQNSKNKTFYSFLSSND